jgi:hypothetical protein
MWMCQRAEWCFWDSASWLQRLVPMMPAARVATMHAVMVLVDRVIFMKSSFEPDSTFKPPTMMLAPATASSLHGRLAEPECAPLFIRASNKMNIVEVIGHPIYEILPLKPHGTNFTLRKIW